MEASVGVDPDAAIVAPTTSERREISRQAESALADELLDELEDIINFTSTPPPAEEGWEPVQVEPAAEGFRPVSVNPSNQLGMSLDTPEELARISRELGKPMPMPTEVASPKRKPVVLQTAGGSPKPPIKSQAPASPRKPLLQTPAVQVIPQAKPVPKPQPTGGVVRPTAVITGEHDIDDLLTSISPVTIKVVPTESRPSASNIFPQQPTKPGPQTMRGGVAAKPPPGPKPRPKPEPEFQGVSSLDVRRLMACCCVSADGSCRIWMPLKRRLLAM
jgi:hypothetical protein